MRISPPGGADTISKARDDVVDVEVGVDEVLAVDLDAKLIVSESNSWVEQGKPGGLC